MRGVGALPEHGRVGRTLWGVHALWRTPGAAGTRSSHPSLFELPSQIVKTDLLETVWRQEQTCPLPSRRTLGPLTPSYKPACVHCHVGGPGCTPTGAGWTRTMAPETPGPSTRGWGSAGPGAPPQHLVGTGHQHAFGRGGILTLFPWRPARLITGGAAKSPPGAQLSPAPRRLCRREEQGRGRTLRRKLGPGSSPHPSSGGHWGCPCRSQTRGQGKYRSHRRPGNFMLRHPGFQTSVTNHT